MRGGQRGILNIFVIVCALLFEFNSDKRLGCLLRLVRTVKSQKKEAFLGCLLIKHKKNELNEKFIELINVFRFDFSRFCIVLFSCGSGFLEQLEL